MKKLTDEQVRAIHRSSLPCLILAKKYGVSAMTIWRIKTGATHEALQLGSTQKYRDLKLQRELTRHYEGTNENSENS